MIYLKIHDTEQGKILAMCDSELIDKVLSEGDIEINIRDYSEFYKGELIDSIRAKKIIDSADPTSANIIGKESISIAIEKSLLYQENIKKICDVPYANMYVMRPK